MPLVCRFCGRELTCTFADLGLSPVSNANVKAEDLEAGEMFYPLRVYICSCCLLVQLPDVRPREELFNGDYAYFSSYSDSWLEHARGYVEMITSRLGLNASSRVVEIASNDGYLLQYFTAKGIPCLGVEPCGNVAAAARAKGVPTVELFFGVDTAMALRKEGYRADLVIGNNVLAHVPDINDLVEGVRVLLAPGGVVTMEFPHVAQLILRNQFDTIYHEHFSYLSFHTVRRIFAAHGLTVFDVEELNTHGGSLRIYAAHDGPAAPAQSARAGRLLEAERGRELDRLTGYCGYQERVQRTKRRLLSFLVDAKDSGKSIAAYGAPAKGNTLLNYCGVRGDIIDYTVDRSPQKQGRYLPGTRIPIFAPDRIRETRPDYVLVLPWNLREEISTQLSYIREWGGKFVVAIPTLEVF